MRTIAIAGQRSGSGYDYHGALPGRCAGKRVPAVRALVDVDPQADLSTRCDVEGEGASLAEVLNGSVPVSDVLVKITPASNCYPVTSL